MKRWMIGLFMSALFLSYQNCGSPNTVADPYGANANKSEGVAGGFEPASTTGIEFEGPRQAGQRPELYHVDLQSGEILNYNEETSKAQDSKCLTDDELAELQSILASAKVCGGEKESDAEVCTMDYKMPYAWLISEKDKEESMLALGESRNGCEKPKDLCGAQPQVLKAFISHIMMTLESRSCE